MVNVKARRGRRAKLDAFTTRTKLVYKVRALAYIPSLRPPHHMQSSPNVTLTNEHKILFFSNAHQPGNHSRAQKRPRNLRSSPSHRPISGLQTQQHPIVDEINHPHLTSISTAFIQSATSTPNKQSRHTTTKECNAHKPNPTNPPQQPPRNLVSPKKWVPPPN